MPGAHCGRCRNSEISDFAEFDRRENELKAAEGASQILYEQANPRFVPKPVGLAWSIENPEVLERRIEILVELQEGINARGFNKERDEWLLKLIYGDPGAAHL